MFLPRSAVGEYILEGDFPYVGLFSISYTYEIENIFSVYIWRYRNTCGSSGEREMLLENTARKWKGNHSFISV